MTNRTLETTSAAADFVSAEETEPALAARTENLSVRFAGVPALDRLDLRLAPRKIHGLLGRNGSGKSTLAATLAGFRRPDEGRVLIEGGDLGTAVEPYENAVATSRICLIRESGDLIAAAPVKHALGLAASLRPNWDEDLAGELLDRFEVPTNKKVQKLSRGKKSALGVVLGLASRAPLTIFDETYLGMDVPSRNLFYDALLADYAEVPRTIVLSTHLVSEVSTVLEEVVILDNGRLVTQAPVDALRGRGASIVGPAAVVDDFTAGFTVLAEEKLGGTKSTTVLGDLDPALLAQATAAGLEIGPVGLQDLFVHLTATSSKGDRR
ncbi:ABC-2 type transport system ATP-binding protein [Kribbella steppae]|uniref:ABC-2 type transport system ATP-binding protein n=1 Tax=Kribbella steppae TaxID=2512223 RepID=A0A4R2H8Z1_9ACTN|nr:ABC transporter ATP-binding protein [Kribbella steppae]TCO22210.1 ABC-2 type transport system ATP-binding protein [Kribbella steppae]